MANSEKNAPFNSLDGVKWPYKKNLLQFFFFQKRKINRWYDRAGPHTKLTKIYDTTYYINVHKQFVKNTLLSIENMFEGARLRASVCMWKIFFLYCRSHDSIWFIRAQYLCSCTPFDFSLNDTWWRHTMRSYTQQRNKKLNANDAQKEMTQFVSCDIRQTNLNIVVQVVFITTEDDSTLFVWLKNTQSKSVFEDFQLVRNSNFQSIDI